VPVLDAEHRAGWYYFTAPNDPACRQRVRYTDGAAPPTGSVTRLECIQSVSVPAQPRPTSTP